MQHVFIIGSKGIPARYGGFEQFVDRLTATQFSTDITYHVACAVDSGSSKEEFNYNGAHCFRIPWQFKGPAKAVFYDIDALRWCIRYIKKQSIEHPIVYILACRIGPFFKKYANIIHELGGMVLVNPDGHEWMRAKWNAAIKRYWKKSEECMIKYADYIVCDSQNIERYIRDEYALYTPKTTYIAYGADAAKSELEDNSSKFQSWLSCAGVQPDQYYLVVGRLVPENNYETMIREFMASSTAKKLVLITKAEEGFLDFLDRKTGFRKDARIKFAGTVYDQELLKKIRECAFAYFHGHEVGGTNPSLLEALYSTQLNLLLDVSFNREVAKDSALYWTKASGSLAKLITIAEGMPESEREHMDKLSKQQIEQRYSWELITKMYEKFFLGCST